MPEAHPSRYGEFARPFFRVCFWAYEPMEVYRDKKTSQY